MSYGRGKEQAVGPQAMKDDAPVGPGEGKTSSSGDLSKRQGLITVNDLVYVLEPDLSVATNKTHKIQYFQQSSYSSGQNAICILNSGADYIDTRRSWLQFDVTPTGTGATTNLYLGANGSACNFVNQITISTRSGDVLCQLFDYNLMQNILLPLTYDKQWFDTVGQTMMYGGGCVANGAKNRMCIPMYVLAPLFGYGRLMPAMLMSGLRIEIQFATHTQAFQSIQTGSYKTAGLVAGGTAIIDVTSAQAAFPVWTPVAVGAVTGYDVTDAQLVLSSVQLSDSIQRSLNELSATNGLEIVYPDYERTSTPIGSATEVNIEIRKSCSRALKAFARLRFTNFNLAGAGAGVRGIGLEIENDSFRAERSFPFFEYQWQLGSLYFPQQAVRSKATNRAGCTEIAPTAYNMLLESFDAYHGGKTVALPYHRVRATAAPYYGGNRAADMSKSSNATSSGWAANVFGVGYNVGEFMPETSAGPGEEGSFKRDAHSIGVTLERSTMFNLAGVPVNNSRVLAFHGRITSDVTGEITKSAVTADQPITLNDRKLDIFLKYVKLCRVFLNNVEVEQ